MTVEQPVAAVDETDDRKCGGTDCPMRLTEPNDAYGFCSGCPSNERLCPACGQWKAQTGWWFGAVDGRLDRWCCADCRYPPMDPAAAAKWPDLAASHPAHGDLVAKFARFEVDLGPLSDEDRFAIASVLSRTATMADAQALHVIAGCLREDRAVDVDVSGMTMEARRTALMALGSAAHGPKTPANLSGAISRLLRAWESWLDLQLPSPGADRRTEAERLAEARTRSLQGRERPV